MNKVLVFGGAGYIGSVLCRKLLDMGKEVICADNLARHGDGLFELIGDPRFKFVQTDIVDVYQVEKVRDLRPDSVILLSSLVGVPACNENKKGAEDVNQYGWLNVGSTFEGVPMVGASTESVYGPSTGEVTEETKPRPNSHYAKTKLEGEYWLRKFGGKALRFVTCIGPSPMMRLNLLPHEIAYDLVHRKVCTVYEGSAPRNFIDIQDFTNALIYALNNYSYLSYDVYNVGTADNVMTKKELADSIQKYAGGDLVYVEYNKDEDGRQYSIDFSRGKEAGFQVTPLEKRNTIENIVKAIRLIRPPKTRYE